MGAEWADLGIGCLSLQSISCLEPRESGQVGNVLKQLLP
jgi:hypothetical protein